MVKSADVDRTANPGVDRKRDRQAAWRGRPARPGLALGGRRCRSAAQGTQRRAARAGTHQARRDDGRPARRQSRCRRTPRHADPRRLPPADGGGHRAARGTPEGGRRRRGRAPYRSRGRRGRARSGRDVARASRGQSADDARVAGSQGHDATKPMPSPPRRRRRPRPRRRSWAPRRSPTTRIPCSPISGSAASERPPTVRATLPAPSIAWSRNSSASAMRGPTTRP